MINKIDFLSPEKLKGDISELNNCIRQGVPSAVFGVHLSIKSIIASFIDSQVLYLTATPIQAAELYNQIKQISGKYVTLLTAKDDVLLYKEAFAKDNLYKRINALYDIQNNAEIIIADIESVMQLSPSKIADLKLVKGNDYDLDLITKQLVAFGYTRSFSVDGKGMFSIRGDILDVFPINAENPLRFDFFGDELESIKPYDIISGERLEEINSFNIITSTDIIIEEDDKLEILKTIENELYYFDKAETLNRAENIYREIKEIIIGNKISEKLSFILPILKNSVSPFSLINREAIIIFDECKLLSDKMTGIYKEQEERLKNLINGGEAFSFSSKQLLEEKHFYSEIENFKKLSLQNFASQNKFFNPLKIFNLKSNQTQKYLYNIKALSGDISAWIKNNYTVALFTENLSKANKLYDVLLEDGIKSRVQKNLTLSGKVNIFPFKLDKGILLHENKLAVIGSGDLYAKKQIEKRLKKKRNDLFTSPEIGDYAVHEQHGVGRITGTRKIETTDGTKDYIALEYNGGDLLYVPVEQMNILSKFMGEGEPSLSKIGGKEFERVKAKAIASIKKLAIDLRKLYSERESAKGYKYQPDNELMAEFENAFEFEPTIDQIASIDEIKKDMESNKVMDRLLCGDVGYGKTEVALRAAFKAILSDKQVALLCPTTILSEQHYNTSIKRFKDFGVKIEVLNRFKTTARQKDILEKLRAGEIDLIIGTHRLLSKDIAFKNLGLLILDEEQRFGVEHKEKIKSIKTNIDCLTMTATPIPRTLYMSLSGIRDISTIESPPKERLPIETCVVEETEPLIRDACIRELSRGGQAFILYNRVESIYQFAAKIKQLIPEGEISITHGRMSEQELENNIIKFYSGKSNILVTTTIIENGIDLPNANTIIIIDSDRLGISQLYQLRGRVGRSNRLAQAYFTFKSDKILSMDAAKRLSAIMEFTELGSGFKIAMRDLEIRGAGNVLGGEQHGHIAKIGYELYSKLLKEELSGEEEKEVDLDIKMTAYIPDKYIESSSARLDCYKKIAEIKDENNYRDLEQVIFDTYGEIPKGVKNLLDIALLKANLQKIKVEKVKIDSKCGEIVFPSLKQLYKDNIINALNHVNNTKIIAVDKPLIYFENSEKQAGVLKTMLAFLNKAATFTKLP
jgi:transcription-repair coupling factor (superfamily II helicase)